ncbi:NAD-dependent succinate-semialdehyde dehydrogenase [Vibrio nitrifigilis]|uniref:NAD-dependent succinate-semialdehyde dehydrogenase n=1 Tax=Vibrio nitrifigilis TaxID=2789781 RepID=A0ABS0GIU5_9VIBR|nr:NAD-dependent succinate-semialdehyde dehydrogenase [Vibrio nitrifigilis]MBF9002262.1 NAD-dependent succinate-semialdehyde dehydrogenase [Vibrio nitrifigilis]
MAQSSFISSLNDPSLLKEQAYYQGQWFDADDSSTIDVINPSTSEVIATVPALSKAQVLDSIEFAEQSWASWRKVPTAERSAILYRWYDLMMENQDDLGLIMTLEQGKPLPEAKGEIAYAASFIKWFAEEARRIQGQTLTSPSADRRIMTIKQPIGVCAAITPWNFPAAMITRKCAPALAAGCPIVVKPADLTPLSALALAELAERAGVPAGIFNVLTGDAELIGGVFTSHDAIRKITFTGSTRVGRLLMEQSASSIKRLSLELGGNAPFIVFDDADIAAAVDGLMVSKFRNAGQTCVCANRVFVHDAIYDEFAAALKVKVEQLVVGDGMAQGTTIGPMINQAAVQKVKYHIEDALENGATLLSGGVPDDDQPFVVPTILTNVSLDSVVCREETFGPLAPLIRFTDEESVIEEANNTPFGLGAYYYTSDMPRAWRVGEALEFGMVGLNSGIISMDIAPFGGIKQSGLGREGSQLGLDEYLEVKAWHMGNL